MFEGWPCWRIKVVTVLWPLIAIWCLIENFALKEKPFKGNKYKKMTENKSMLISCAVSCTILVIYLVVLKLSCQSY